MYVGGGEGHQKDHGGKGMQTCIDLQIFTSTNVNLYNQLHQLYTLLQINHFYSQYVVKDYSSIMFQY